MLLLMPGEVARSRLIVNPMVPATGSMPTAGQREAAVLVRHCLHLLQLPIDLNLCRGSTPVRSQEEAGIAGGNVLVCGGGVSI